LFYIGNHLLWIDYATIILIAVSLGESWLAASAFLFLLPFVLERNFEDKKHLKNVGPIRHCETPHAHSPGVASGTVARRLRIDVHDNDNA